MKNGKRKKIDNYDQFHSWGTGDKHQRGGKERSVHYILIYDGLMINFMFNFMIGR